MINSDPLTDEELRIKRTVEHTLKVSFPDDEPDRVRREVCLALTAQASIIHQLVEAVENENVRQSLAKTYRTLSRDISVLKRNISLSIDTDTDSDNIDL